MSENGDIAVIGIGCRFPDADNPEVFYENLCAGKDSVREIPEERWSHHRLFSPNGGKNRISSKWGGFLSDVDQFDARFFKILPSEAEFLDPQQKLFLSCSWEALEDAGYSQRRALAGKPVGVYAGVTWNEFSLLANECGYLRDKYAGPGSLYWGIPNRVSYFFDLVGPSLAIDAACSSSLLALHLAAQAIASGECEMALAGGVNLSLHPAKYLFLSSANFLSSDGKCRGFAEGGSGYVPSEGVGVVVLKRMESAVASGDRIYGCIKATSTNHGGRATGYTVPNPRAQAALIGAALRKANVSADQIRFVECHGTGTDLGDPVEIAGLRAAFQGATSRPRFCGIGTVKSNIGHCEAAAGVASLVKVLMSMRHGILPRTLHAEIPNRKIDFRDSPFYLVQQNEPLNIEGSRLLAGISSFGAGGSNAHCIVEAVSAPAERKGLSAPVERLQLTPISARTEESAREYCRELLAHLRRHRPSLDAVVRTLRRREEHEHRVVLVASSLDGLIDALQQVVASSSASSIVVGAPPGQTPVPMGERLRADAEKWVRRAASFESWPAPTSGSSVWLPTYRFERARSWLDSARVLYRRIPNPKPIHPLLDSNESTAKCGAFKKILHRHEYFVAEHDVQGEPVLPGVCHLEMAQSAGSRYLDSETVRLLDVWFLEPVSLEGRYEVPLRLEITPAGEDHAYELRQPDTGVLHSAGKMQTVPNGETAAERLHLDDIEARCTNLLTPQAAYRLFGEKGIAQRGRFQVVTDFRCNEQEAIGRLVLSSAFAEGDEYGFNPTMLDGAVQVAMLHFHQNVCSGVVLPFQIGAYRRHGSTPATATVVARVKNLAARRYDIFITDAQGNILAELEDFVLKEVREKRTERRPVCFSMAWHQSEESPLRVTSPTEEVPALWLGSNLPADRLADMGRAGTLLKWEPGQAFPELALSRWLGEVAGKVPRIVLPFRAPCQITPDLGSPEAIEMTSGWFGALQALGRQNVPLDVIVGLRAETTSARPWAVAMAALVRCVNLELPKLRARLVEIRSDASDRSWTDPLAAELRRSDAASYVRWQSGRRYVAEPTWVDLETHPQSRTASSAPWLITGAGGALGFMVARELLQAGRSVAMLGRRPLDEQKLRALGEFPCDRWEYVVCDARVEGAVADAIARVTQRFGSKWGLVHCAGVLDDGAFLQKAWPAFERVVSSKVGTLLNVCRALAPHDLEQVLLFSSLSAAFGSRGQTDYAFANGFLDGLADPDGPGLPGSPRVSSIDWPYWQEGGMRIGKDRLSSYAQNFLSEPLPSGIGLAWVRAFLQRAPLQVGVLHSSSNLQEIEARLRLKPLPTSPEALRVQPLPAATPENNGQAGPEERRARIRRYWVRFLERELKLSLKESDLEDDLSNLGVDSIAKMDLLSKLEAERRFAKLPQSLFDEHTTVVRLVEFFWNHHQDADYSAR